MKTNIFIPIFIAISFLGFAQSSAEFDKLKNKADSAYNTKDYSLSAKYYEKLIQFPESDRPEIIGGLYYNMACIYSLSKERTKSLTYLEKSFVTHNSKMKTNPVSAVHISRDTDLDNIRETKEFENILTKFYPSKVSKFILSKEVSYASLIDYILLTSNTVEDYTIDIINKTIYWEKSDGSYVLNTKRLDVPIGNGLLNERIAFANCKFHLNFIWEAYNSGSDLLEELRFEDCVFYGRFFLFNVNLTYPPQFTKCEFKDVFYLETKFSFDRDFTMNIDGNLFNGARLFIRSENKIGFQVLNNTSTDSSDFSLLCPNVSVAEFTGNSFKNKNLDLSLNSIGVLRFNNNQFNNLNLHRTNIESEFDFSNTIINKLSLFETYFPEAPTHDIDWRLIGNSKLGILLLSQGSYGYLGHGITNMPKIFKHKSLDGGQSEAISNDQNFREIIGLHSMFLNTYKFKNDIESYNGCFIAIKELQSKRLEYLYHINRTFESYFRWKLSQLLKYYVRYGTDPARAIVISVYIIILFGAFFFFFPSDWDITSKSRLLENYKDFIQKNEKGYIKPFLILLWGFLISLLNALTLSLNAFVTLGFGNIPTHGIAKYFCVLEGFFGWFLLSIFTVAMINQVL